MTWQIGGPAEQHSLVIRAQEPGAVYTSTTTVLQPGMPPANGSLYYLRPDNTWTPTDTVYLSPSLSSTVAVTLPSSLEGEWQLEAILRNTASGKTVAVDARSLLASSKPAMLLRLSRPIANTGDRVRAELLTSAWQVASVGGDSLAARMGAAAGLSNQTVKIAAWLTTPGGGQLSLPGLEPGISYAHEGVISNGKISLLDQDLADLGPGDYQIQARTFYSDSGSLMTRAVASFSVCDTPGTISGTVYAATGQPLGGGSPRFTLVTALDVDDGAVTASAAIDASGNYSLTLMPGRYLLSAKVLDGAGLHTAQDQQLLKAGCSGVGATRSLTATAPVAFSAARLGEQKTSSAARPGAEKISSLSRGAVGVASASGATIPNPSALLDYEATGISDSTAQLIFAVFESGLIRAGQRVELTDRQAVAASFSNVSNLQGTGSDAGIDLSEIAGALNKRFTILLKIENVASVRRLTVIVVDLLQAKSLDNQSRMVTGSEDDAWLGAGEALGNALGPNLYKLLDDARDRPIVPKLTLSAAPSSVQVGGPVYITATLKDADGTPAPQGKGIDIRHDSPVGRQTITGVTDGSGAYQGQLAVGGTPGLGRIEASFVGLDYQTAVPQTNAYRVAGPNDLALKSAKVQLRPAETAEVCASLMSNGAARAGTVVTMTVNTGSLDRATVTTGADGQGCATYTAGSYSRIADVTGEAAVTVSQTVMADLDFVIDGNVSFSLSAGKTSLPNGGVTNVRAYVTAGGASVPGLPVEFTLSGNGALSAPTASTDYYGSASINYAAPASGSGTAVINAVATVESTTYTQSITLQYQPPTCQVSLPTVPRCYDVVNVTGIYPIRLTNDGRVLGYWCNSTDNANHVRIWQNGSVSEQGALNTLGGDSYVSKIADVNEAGVAVGTITRPEFGFYSGTAVKWGNDGNPIRLQSGSEAYAINLNGDVVGVSSNPYFNYAYLWPGSLQPGPGGYITGTQIASAQSFAYDINDSGKVAFTRNYTTSLWYDGQVTPIGLLPGAEGTSMPTRINNSGYVVGESKTAGGANHAFFWDGSTMTDLGVLPGYDESRALGVNSSQQVVGWSGANTPFLWEKTSGTGKMYDLNKMVDYASLPLPSGYMRMGINESGWILIYGNGPAVVLKPRG